MPPLSGCEALHRPEVGWTKLLLNEGTPGIQSWLRIQGYPRFSRKC